MRRHKSSLKNLALRKNNSKRFATAETAKHHYPCWRQQKRLLEGKLVFPLFPFFENFLDCHLLTLEEYIFTGEITLSRT